MKYAALRKWAENGFDDWYTRDVRELLAERDQLEYQCKKLDELCNSWMKDYDALKAKYEPLVAVTSLRESGDEK